MRGVGDVSRVERAADESARILNKLGDAGADVAETIGHAARDGSWWVAERAGPLAGFVRWLGGADAAAGDLIGSIPKAFASIVGGSASAAIKIGGGLATLDSRLSLRGARDLAVGVLGGLILVLGKAVAFLQALFVVGRPRPLRRKEEELVRRVFRRSIATYNLRVVEGHAGVFSRTDHAFVLGDTIYMKGKKVDTHPDTFVHECVHVWQNQHEGPRYIAEALMSQKWGAGYDWQGEADRGKEWPAFEREAQAELVEDVYEHHRGTGQADAEWASTAMDGDGFGVGGSDYSALAQRAITELRSRSPWRPFSALFG